MSITEPLLHRAYIAREDSLNAAAMFVADAAAQRRLIKAEHKFLASQALAKMMFITSQKDAYAKKRYICDTLRAKLEFERVRAESCNRAEAREAMERIELLEDALAKTIEVSLRELRRL
jgi:hypothetical protein